MDDSDVEAQKENIFLDLIRDKLGGTYLTNRQLISSSTQHEYDDSINDKSQSPRDVIQIIDDYKLSLRADIIQNKRTSLSSNTDFELLDKQLSETQTLNYEQFLEHSLQSSASAKRFFTAQYFLMFPKDKTGAIASEAFLR